MRCAALCFILLAGSTFAQAGTFVDRQITVEGEQFHYKIYVPELPRAKPDAVPVVLYLHGAGGIGSDGKQTETGLGLALREHPERFPFIAVFPQASARWVVPRMEELALATLDATLAEPDLHADRSRVYLVGYSVGAAGAWRIASGNIARFAAVVAISGTVHSAPKLFTAEELVADQKAHPYLQATDPFAALAEQLTSVPVAVFHGTADTVVPPAESRSIVRALEQRKAHVRFTEYPRVSHTEILARVLNDATLWQWLLAQRRSEAH
jgi:predicted peptidase